MKNRPKYQEIYESILEQIHSKEYIEEIPSETELMELYHASRITVRHAIELLQSNGYIHKSRGKRAVVISENKIQSIEKVFSYTEEILKKGMLPSRKVLDLGLRLPTEIEKQNLHLEKTDPIFYIKRIIYANQNPICLTTAAIAYSYFPDIELCDFEKHSLYDIIENQYQIPILHSNLQFKAISASEEIATVLNIKKDMPLIFFKATTFAKIQNEIQPFEYFESYYITENFEYSLTQYRG